MSAPVCITTGAFLQAVPSEMEVLMRLSLLDQERQNVTKKLVELAAQAGELRDAMRADYRFASYHVEAAGVALREAADVVQGKRGCEDGDAA